jgi:hypothetical protein
MSPPRDDDRTYRLAATLETDGTLHARIFKGVPLLGRTEILKRGRYPFSHGPVLTLV